MDTVSQRDVQTPKYSSAGGETCRLPEIEMWPTHAPMDGYICESLTGPRGTASATLSKYFGKPVHLVRKGRKPRRIDPTVTFPELDATAKYQDMYPLLVLSEESTVAVDTELRKHVGSQGIAENWSVDNVPIERWVSADSVLIMYIYLFVNIYLLASVCSQTKHYLMNNVPVRFRPNIVFRGGGPFAEDNWEEISIGSERSPSITLVSKCTRCLVSSLSSQLKTATNFFTRSSPTSALKRGSEIALSLLKC